MSGQMGRAMVNFGVGIPWEMREYPVPDPEPGAIVVKITMASICGTDVHLYQGDFGPPAGVRQKPAIMGHEFVGRVHSLGAGVATDTTGQPLKVELPYDGAEVATVYAAGKEQVDAAVEAAHAAAAVSGWLVGRRTIPQPSPIRPATRGASEPPPPRPACQQGTAP